MERRAYTVAVDQEREIPVAKLGEDLITLLLSPHFQEIHFTATADPTSCTFVIGCKGEDVTITAETLDMALESAWLLIESSGVSRRLP